MRTIILTIICALMLACGRSKPPQYYVLTPLPYQHASQNTHMRLGIDIVNTPGYLDKQPLSIYCTPNQSKSDEFNLWGEDLSNNIKQVIKTDLEVLLPGLAVEYAPWDNSFNPDYRLRIDIAQFKAMIQGNTLLQANYMVYKNDHLIKNYAFMNTQKIPTINPCAMVQSLNETLHALTRDIACHLRNSKG